MVRYAKLLAILLAAIMVMAQAPFALASGIDPLQAAMEAGREVSFEGKITWHGVPFIDGKTNGLIASVLNGAKIAGRSGSEGEVSYGSCGLYVMGQPVATIDAVVTEEGVHLNSSFLPRPITFKMEDIAKMAEKFAAPAAEEMTGLPSGMLESVIASTMESVFAQLAGSMAMLQEVMAPMMESILPPVTAWAEAVQEGELYEGALDSAYDVDMASAMLRGVTFEDVLDLLDIVLPPIMENDAYWTFIIEQMKPVMGMMGQKMPPEDELLAGVKAELEGLASALPQLREAGIEAYMFYAECYNAAGDVVTNIVKCIVADENMPVDFHLEWLPGGESVYCRQIVGTDGQAVNISALAPVVVEDADGTVTSSQVSVVVSVIEGGEVSGEFVAAVTSKATDAVNTSKCEGLLQLLTSGLFSEEIMGVEANWLTTAEADGVDAKTNAKVDLVFRAGDIGIPLVTLEYAAASGAPQGLPAFYAEVTAEEAE